MGLTGAAGTKAPWKMRGRLPVGSLTVSRASSAAGTAQQEPSGAQGAPYILGFLAREARKGLE